jgi:DNA-binding CsgD family transcriptional regulator
MRTWNIARIEQAFADAAIDPARWGDALEIAATETNSFGALILPVSGGGPVPGLPHTDSMSRLVELYFRDNWCDRDTRYLGAQHMQRNGVVDDLDIIDAEALSRHPYYQELLAPFGLQWFAGVGMMSGNDVWCLSIQRTIASGPFSPDQKRDLASLSMRLSSSVALARALGHGRASGALAAFEMCGTAVVLLNSYGEVFRANQSAEGLFGDDIKIVQKRLVSKSPAATAALDRALRDLVWRQDSSALASPILLPRAQYRPLLACPVRLSNFSSNILSDCDFALVLIDSEKRFRPVERQLQAFFDLTSAEAKLAARIADGSALGVAASELGIGKETGRSQLKSIFRKTGTHRQAELVALLMPIIRQLKSEIPVE